jgi:hypothetical protein
MQAGERAHVMVAVSLADLRSGIGQAMLADTTSTAGPAASGNTGTASKATAGQAALSNTGTPPKAGAGLATFSDTGATVKGDASPAALSDTGTTPNPAAGQAALGTAPKASVGRSTLGDTGTIPKPAAGQGALDTMPKAGVGRAMLGNTGAFPTPAAGQAALGAMSKAVGRAMLGDLGTISAAEARIHACDCMLIPAVLGTKSELLDLGRQHRLISTPLRRALYLRDRGCAFPGCHRPPRHCQGHHIRHWSDGGPTELSNLVLMCAHHHRLLHRSGWQVRIAADGLPEFLPPAFLDKRRKPRRNNLHQPLPFAA